MVHSNIFYPRNNWAVINLNCRKAALTGMYHVRVAHIIKSVMGDNPLELKNYRGRGSALSRQIFCDMMRKYSGCTLMAIGNYIGKGHDTVLHSINAVQNLYDTDRKFRLTYNRINMKVSELKK